MEGVEQSEAEVKLMETGKQGQSADNKERRQRVAENDCLSVKAVS